MMINDPVYFHFNPEYAQIYGALPGLLLSLICDLTTKGTDIDADGWLLLSDSQLKRLTGMTQTELDYYKWHTAVQMVVEEKLADGHGLSYYRINRTVVNRVRDAFRASKALVR